MEPVGELDEDDADVLRHRQEHLPDVLGLLLLVAVGAELGQLGDAVDEVGDLGAEPLLDVGEAVLGVLGDVVEERRLDGDGSRPRSARICADAIGWVTYGSPVARCWPACASTARSNASPTGVEIGLRVVAGDGLERASACRASRSGSVLVAGAGLGARRGPVDFARDEPRLPRRAGRRLCGRARLAP